MTKHFLSINNINADELNSLLEVSSKLKSSLKNNNNQDYSDLLKNKTLGMIFEKPSLRTRVSFEVGMQQLGGSCVVLNSSEIGAKTRESVQDISKVLSRYLDAVMIRTFEHSFIEEFAENSKIPVINALTDIEHPCQTIADLLTIKEHFGGFSDVKIAYIGDGNNTVKSLMLACTKLGIKITVACPLGFEPGKEYESEFATVVHGVGEACLDANVVYTDVWASIGEAKEAQKLKEKFAGYQINNSLLTEFAKKDMIVLHCLPAHRGDEITAEVLKNHEETILNQSENRLHTQKAILLKLLKISI